MRDNPETTAQLRALIDRGIRIALDDFGTGYSALAYLARLPHHRIKLDKAFVQDLGNPTTAELIRAIIALARAQGVAVTAEGVERPEHLALVRRIGFTHAQGYAIGAPLADPVALFAESAAGRGRRRRSLRRPPLIPGADHATTGEGAAEERRAREEPPPVAPRPCFVQDPYPFYDARPRRSGRCSSGRTTASPAPPAMRRSRRCCATGASDASCRPGCGPARPAHLADFYALDDRSLLDREPPAHTRLRGLVLRAFTSRRIAGLAPEIAALARGLADALPEGEVDLLPAFAERLPVVVIARLLGVPDAAADDLLAWSHAMVAMYQARRDRAVEDAANAAARDFAAFLRAARSRRAAAAPATTSSPSSSPPRRRATGSTPTS